MTAMNGPAGMIREPIKQISHISFADMAYLFNGAAIRLRLFNNLCFV